MSVSKLRISRNWLQTIKIQGVSVFCEKFFAFKSSEIFLKFLLPSTEGDSLSILILDLVFFIINYVYFYFRGRNVNLIMTFLKISFISTLTSSSSLTLSAKSFQIFIESPLYLEAFNFFNEIIRYAPLFRQEILTLKPFTMPGMA